MRGLGNATSIGDDASGDHVLEFSGSCEASTYAQFHDGKATSPQCWLLAGYLSGIVSAHVGYPVMFLESKCAAYNHTACQFIGRSRAEWPEKDRERLSVYEEDNIRQDLLEVGEQLKLTRDRYQNLFEQSSVPMFIVDPDSGAFLDINVAAEQLTGHTHDELARMTLFDMCPPKEHHQILDQMKELMHAGAIADKELSVLRKDGQPRVIMLAMKLLSFGGQRVIQAVMRDVTDLKLSEQKEKDLQSQLVRSERLSSIGHLAASVAHELKNPLGAIRNAIYYIKNALANNPLLESDPHLSEILKLAEAEVDGSVTIIGELLDFSRVVSIVPRRTMLNDVVEEMPGIVLVPDNVELIWDLDPGLPAATVDPDRLKQVFTNIMSNAVQAMPQGGKLTIQTRHEVGTSSQSGEQQNLVCVSFEDTGSGIAPWHLAKIFEPLFTTKARGTGLGLAISNNIVEKHGGSIIVTSQQGKGTCFTVKLPLVPPNDKEE